MPIERSPALFEFPSLEGRRVVASIDGGVVMSNAGALLLGAADRAINLVQHLAVRSDLVGQRRQCRPLRVTQNANTRVARQPRQLGIYLRA